MVSHVDNKTAVRVKPPKNPVFSEAILWFTDALGSIPTIPQADWFNMIQAELLGMAEALGVTPDKLDDGQLGKALIAAFEKIGGDIADLPKVLDRLGDSAVDAASQRIVNVVNKLAKDAMQSSLQANDKANQAKQEAYEAKQIGEDAKAEAKEAMDEALANIPNSKNYQSIEDLEQSVKGGLAIGNGESVPSKDLKNLYLNGLLKYDGYDFYPLASENALTNQFRANYFGGQLAELKSCLTNPLVQKMGINFFGDSNMWGSGTRQNASVTPRTGGVSDARDHFASNSFVNLVKRYIGKKYFNDAAPILSNYETSPTGQSICTYKQDVVIYPYDNEYFSSYKGVPSGIPISSIEWTGTKTGWRRKFWYSENDTLQPRLEFTFTGEKFGIYYTKAVNVASLKVYVNGKEVKTIVGQSDTTVRQSYEEVTFPYVKDAIITLEGSVDGVVDSIYKDFYVEAIKIEKTVVIQNNGIIGSYAGIFNRINIDKLIEAYDLFTFIQFGGNDRNAPVTYGARCISSFTENMSEMIDKLSKKKVKTIIMGTTPGIDRDEQMFTRQDAANAALSLASKKSIDFIDNYSVMTGSDIYMYTNDGTHLTVLGNCIVARNIITALESSSLKVPLNKKWVNVEKDRFFGVTYTNETDHELQLHICVDIGSGGIVIDGKELKIEDGTAYSLIQNIIQPGSSYEIKNGAQGTIISWWENKVI